MLTRKYTKAKPFPSNSTPFIGSGQGSGVPGLAIILKHTFVTRYFMGLVAFAWGMMLGASLMLVLVNHLVWWACQPVDATWWLSHGQILAEVLDGILILCIARAFWKTGSWIYCGDENKSVRSLFVMFSAGAIVLFLLPFFFVYELLWGHPDEKKHRDILEEKSSRHLPKKRPNQYSLRNGSKMGVLVSLACQVTHIR